MIPRELVSIFNDKELELLISGLPEIDCKLDHVVCVYLVMRLIIYKNLLFFWQSVILQPIHRVHQLHGRIPCYSLVLGGR